MPRASGRRYVNLGHAARRRAEGGNSRLTFPLIYHGRHNDPDRRSHGLSPESLYIPRGGGFTGKFANLQRPAGKPNQRISKVLPLTGGVWRNSMTDDVWQRSTARAIA